MKEIEHDALMDSVEKKKKQLTIMIALLVIAFAAYLIFVRPLLQAYL